MLRRIRKVACVLAAVLPLVLIPMWMRSYHRGDEMCIGLWGDRAAIVASKQGRVVATWVYRTSFIRPKRWTISSHSYDDGTSFPVGQIRDYESKLGFGRIIHPAYVLDFDAPHGTALVWSGLNGTWGSVTLKGPDGKSFGGTTSWQRSSYDGIGVNSCELGYKSSTISVKGYYTPSLPSQGVIVPYWFLLLLAGVSLAATWPGSLKRYSLRGLLAAMAYVSVVLALVRSLDS